MATWQLLNSSGEHCYSPAALQFQQVAAAAASGHSCEQQASHLQVVMDYLWATPPLRTDQSDFGAGVSFVDCYCYANQFGIVFDHAATMILEHLE